MVLSLKNLLMKGEPGQRRIEALEVHTRNGEQAARLREAARLVQVGRYEAAIPLSERIGRRDRTNRALEQCAHFLAAQGRFREAWEQMRLALAPG
jgi:hypothetical protein